MKHRVIGFSGLIGSGKSSAAKHLVIAHDFERIAFAGPIKDMMRALGLTGRQVDGPEKETPCDLLGGCTPRRAMQTLGTDWGRQMVAGDLWLRIWLARARSAMTVAGGSDVVVDDVRFPNEVEAVHSLGGIVIRVKRPGTIPAPHASEAQPLAADLVLVNAGSLTDLYARVDYMLAGEIADALRAGSARWAEVDSSPSDLHA